MPTLHINSFNLQGKKITKSLEIEIFFCSSEDCDEIGEIHLLEVNVMNDSLKRQGESRVISF